MLPFQVLQEEEKVIQSKCIMLDTSHAISSLTPAQKCDTAGIVASDCIPGLNLKIGACNVAHLDINTASTNTEIVHRNAAHQASAVDTDIFRIREPICPGK